MSSVCINENSINVAAGTLTVSGFARPDVVGTMVTCTLYDTASASTTSAAVIPKAAGAAPAGEVWTATAAVTTGHSYAINVQLMSGAVVLAECTAFTGVIGISIRPGRHRKK
jgi:hypothetical protein